MRQAKAEFVTASKTAPIASVEVSIVIAVASVEVGISIAVD